MRDQPIVAKGRKPSPIQPVDLASDRRLDGLAWTADGRGLVWLEVRDGKGVLVYDAGDGDAVRELTGQSVRAMLGYGGGDFCLGQGHVYFVAAADGRIWRQALEGGRATPITPAHGHAASPTVSPDGRCLVYVHRDGDEIDRLAVIDVRGRCWPRILSQGRDFYMQPRWSPDGKHLAWIAWDHPNMPWQASDLCIAELKYEKDEPEPSNPGLPGLGPARRLAGGASEAIFQPEFHPDGRSLYFVSDASGWGQLTRLDLADGRVETVTKVEAEHGRPAWAQDLRSYALSGDGAQAFIVRDERGFRQLFRIELTDGSTHRVRSLTDYGEVSHLAAAPVGDRIALIASGQTTPPRLLVSTRSETRPRIVARSSREHIPEHRLAKAEALSWPTTGQATCHGLYYPPAPDGLEALAAPPLVVWAHGGPSGQVTAGWNRWAQFLATRGYAVLAVNYRGSSGHGRAYLEALDGHWGILDVEDVVSGVEHLVSDGRALAGRCAIMGGSAGGFTVLQAMIHAPETFACGIDSYGVSDLLSLAASTHKFESRYLDGLVGSLPEHVDRYRERSPALHANRITRPLAIFQGDEDRAVPREQSDRIAASLARRGVPHVYHVYAGEGHGFRRADSIEHYWQAIDDFLKQHLVYASS